MRGTIKSIVDLSPALLAAAISITLVMSVVLAFVSEDEFLLAFIYGVVLFLPILAVEITFVIVFFWMKLSAVKLKMLIVIFSIGFFLLTSAVLIYATVNDRFY